MRSQVSQESKSSYGWPGGHAASDEQNTKAEIDRTVPKVHVRRETDPEIPRRVR